MYVEAAALLAVTVFVVSVRANVYDNPVCAFWTGPVSSLYPSMYWAMARDFAG